ncbi:MAG: methyltransferase domain-containing protein [Chloroflexi bacterium]|nr:methyltransferase domain-containing protein [Chloroflexota bacterium]
MSGPEWDAATYDRIADPMHRWGLGVLERLPLLGHERVLDAGCGSGRVTEALAERLSAGHVVALDASAAMLDEARRRLARFGEHASFVQADLGHSLPLDAPVDAILSTAVFHWIPDHDALFRNLAAVIRPGGRLVAQCGGSGNIASLERILQDMGASEGADLNFAKPLATMARLEAAGFHDAEVWLTDEPTRLEPGASLEAYLETICLRDHVARLPPADRPEFIREVARRMPEPVLDYVRLNIVAIRR